MSEENTLPDEAEFQEMLRNTFLDEAAFLVDDCETTLLSLETSDDKDGELGKIFRIAHSIKGSAAAVGFSDLTQFAHIAEDCLSVLRTNSSLVEKDVISVLLESNDAIRNRIEQYHIDVESKEEWDTSLLEERLKEWTARLEGKSVDTTKKPAPSPGKPAEAKVKPKNKADATPAKKNTEKAATPSPTNGPKAPAKQKKKAAASTLLRIDSMRIDAVMDLVGELVVLKSQILQNESATETHNPQFEALLSLLDKAVRDLYDRVLSVRMTSLKALFLKLQRTIRDLSDKLGKPLDFTTSGEDTELDRALIEQLGDPLVHLCRNAIDHGIEDISDRLDAGKDEKGTVHLSAYNKGSNVIIEITDDGKGLSRPKIFDKALERGLLPKDSKLDDVADSVLFKLIFSAGFSTAAVVTDVSGRGVGMDVVRSNVEAMKGTIEIESAEGKGSTIRLQLPLTTAITEGIMVMIGPEQYIIPIESVVEFTKLCDVTITKVEGAREVIETRGSFIPLIRLNKFLDHQSETSEELVVIIENKADRVALLVDQVLGQSQVVLKSLGDEIDTTKSISGAAILGDGHVGLILDPTILAEEALMSSTKGASAC